MTGLRIGSAGEGVKREEGDPSRRFAPGSAPQVRSGECGMGGVVAARVVAVGVSHRWHRWHGLQSGAEAPLKSLEQGKEDGAIED